MIPLDKLIALECNKYIFSRAAMLMIDKIGNMKNYPDNEESWKIVPNVLEMMLNDELNYKLRED